MKFGWLFLAGVVAVALANPADARPRKHKKARAVAAQCVDGAKPFSWNFLLPGNARPDANGCAPPVYANGSRTSYVGQDPDPNIRAGLRRDPRTGYSADGN